MSEGWYYSANGGRKGPVTVDSLRALVEAGVVEGGTPIWREGMNDWEPAHRHVSGLVPPIPAVARTQADRSSGHSPTYGGRRAYHEQVGMVEAFKRFWVGYVDFSGRSNRGEYWWAFLAMLLFGLLIAFIDLALFDTSGQFQPLSSILTLATIIPNLAISVRRLHDIDRTGWWVVAPLGLLTLGGGLFGFAAASGSEPILGIAIAVIGVVMGIVILVWFCQRGTSSFNRFG